jgi:hypothetical protein
MGCFMGGAIIEIGPVISIAGNRQPRRPLFMIRSMTQSIFYVSAWVTALLVMAGLIAVWAIGWWWGNRHRGGPTMGSKVDDAALALMGLLLGFTFAMALQKHDNRRDKVVQDSNAIGDFYTTASLLEEPVRSQLRDVIHAYAKQRLALATQHEAVTEEQLDAAIVKINESHSRMTELVHEASIRQTPVVVPLVQTLNGLTSSHAARLASARDRLPGSIVALLFLAAVVSVALMARSQGADGRKATFSTFFFICMVAFTLYVTLDLNQPSRGLIRLSQEPMERLITAMEQ